MWWSDCGATAIVCATAWVWLGELVGALIHDSVAQIRPDKRTSARLAFLQARKRRQGPGATGWQFFLLSQQPGIDAHEIDGRGDLNMLHVHLVLPADPGLAQSAGSDGLGDRRFDPRSPRVLLLKGGGDLLLSSLLQGQLRGLAPQGERAPILAVRTERAHRAGGTPRLGKLDHRDGLASFVLSLPP